MTKVRRTRKDRQNARHQFSWKDTTAQAGLGTSVKRQFQMVQEAQETQPVKTNKGEYSGNISSEVIIKKDILRSLALALVILALETVIYFAWKD